MENVLSYLVFKGSNGLKFVLLDCSVEMDEWFDMYSKMLNDWGLWWDVIEVKKGVGWMNDEVENNRFIYEEEYINEVYEEMKLDSVMVQNNIYKMVGWLVYKYCFNFLNIKINIL